jgi:hypothetical protein
MKLYELAHARAGDKGDSSILFLAPYRPDDFEPLTVLITERVIANVFGRTDPSLVKISLAPALGAMTIAIRQRLSGGVTRSPNIDPHGKTLSGHLLDLDLNLVPELDGAKSDSVRRAAALYLLSRASNRR